MNVYEKCAMVLVTLGDRSGAEVLKHLEHQEVAKISRAMVTLGRFTRVQLEQVIAELQHDAQAYSDITINSRDYLRNLLVLTLGEARANSLFEDILENTNGENRGIDALNDMEPSAVSDLIGHEHPQIITTILVHLNRRQSAEILAHLDEQIRNDVMLRIATFGGVQPLALDELTAELNVLMRGKNVKRSKMGGIRPAAEILNFMPTQHEESAISAVRELDPSLAQKLIDEMFIFEHIVDLDDRSLQRILQDVDSESLIIALKGADQPLKDKCFRNMSRRQAELLIEELASRAPVRMSQVEAEQKKIMLIVRELEERGEIKLGRGEDLYV